MVISFLQEIYWSQQRRTIKQKCSWSSLSCMDITSGLRFWFCEHGVGISLRPTWEPWLLVFQRHGWVVTGLWG